MAYSLVQRLAMSGSTLCEIGVITEYFTLCQRCPFLHDSLVYGLVWVAETHARAFYSCSFGVNTHFGFDCAVGMETGPRR